MLYDSEVMFPIQHPQLLSQYRHHPDNVVFVSVTTVLRHVRRHAFAKCEVAHTIASTAITFHGTKVVTEPDVKQALEVSGMCRPSFWAKFGNYLYGVGKSTAVLSWRNFVDLVERLSASPIHCSARRRVDGRRLIGLYCIIPIQIY